MNAEKKLLLSKIKPYCFYVVADNNLYRYAEVLIDELLNYGGTCEFRKK